MDAARNIEGTVDKYSEPMMGSRARYLLNIAQNHCFLNTATTHIYAKDKAKTLLRRMFHCPLCGTGVLTGQGYLAGSEGLRSGALERDGEGTYRNPRGAGRDENQESKPKQATTEGR